MKEVIARQIEPIHGEDAWKITDEDIVRCCDCKYMEETNKDTYFGTQVTWYNCTELWNKSEEHKVVEPDYYCAWGDRK